jgi:arsenate reductase (glutaredoxin)
MTATIWHNPDCGTSRNTLAMLRAAGAAPVVIEYLKDTPSREALARAFAAAGLTARQAMREKGTPAVELGLLDATDEAILDAMPIHPILINRPFVFTARGTRLCRPSERVLEILETPLPRPFTKEDGEVVA